MSDNFYLLCKLRHGLIRFLITLLVVLKSRTIFAHLVFWMRRTCIGSGVLFRGRSHSTRGSTDNYPNDSFRPSLYPHSRIMQRSRDKNGFRPRSHAEAKKRPAYADWPHINGNNRFTELYKHANLLLHWNPLQIGIFVFFHFYMCTIACSCFVLIRKCFACTITVFFTYSPKIGKFKPLCLLLSSTYYHLHLKLIVHKKICSFFSFRKQRS